MPGDPVDIMLGEQASTFDKESLRRELELDKPISVQYFSFLSRLGQMDLGRSLHSRKPVKQIILNHFPATAELTVTALFFALATGIPLGIGAALKAHGWRNIALTSFSLLSMSIPGIFLGPLLIWIFAVQLLWFPVSERGGVMHLVLPALSLALPICALIAKMTRVSILEVLKEDYMRTARAKGLPSFYLYGKHALANALIPLITVVGLQVGALLTGTVITETIFDWPGVGTLLIQAIQKRDYPLVQGCVLLISFTYMTVNLVTDIAYVWANPKVSFK